MAWNFLKKIRENDYTTKAIMLTAHTDKEFLLDAISLQLTRYLVKPVSRKDLKEALDFSIMELLKYTVSPIQKKLIYLKTLAGTLN